MLTNKTVHVCNKSANIEFACQPNERDAHAAESYVITSLMLLTCASLRNSVNSTGQHQQHANQTQKKSRSCPFHFRIISLSMRPKVLRSRRRRDANLPSARACLCVNGVTPARAYNITTTTPKHIRTTLAHVWCWYCCVYTYMYVHVCCAFDLYMYLNENRYRSIVFEAIRSMQYAVLCKIMIMITVAL